MSTRLSLIIILLAIAMIPVRCKGKGHHANAQFSLRQLVHARTAIRRGDPGASMELVEQMLAIEQVRGLDGTLAAEWLIAGRLFGRLGSSEAGVILFRWVECRAREAGWRARAAHEALQLLARTSNTVTRQDWVALGLVHALPGELIGPVALKCSTTEGALTQSNLMNAIEKRRSKGGEWGQARLRCELRALFGP
jgi:hypothetical protein